VTVLLHVRLAWRMVMILRPTRHLVPAVEPIPVVPVTLLTFEHEAAHVLVGARRSHAEAQAVPVGDSVRSLGHRSPVRVLNIHRRSRGKMVGRHPQCEQNSRLPKVAHQGPPLVPFPHSPPPRVEPEVVFMSHLSACAPARVRDPPHLAHPQFRPVELVPAFIPIAVGSRDWDENDRYRAG
jgi:hypothetical protein